MKRRAYIAVILFVPLLFDVSLWDTTRRAQSQIKSRAYPRR